MGEGRTVVVVVAGDGDDAAARGEAVRATLGRTGFDAVVSRSPDDSTPLPDGDWVALVAVEGSDRALRLAASHRRMGAVVLVDPTVDGDGVDLVADWEELPLLVVADPASRAALRDAVELHGVARHPSSDVRIGRLADGTLAEEVASWLQARRRDAGTRRPVTFTAEDGWELHGDLLLPDRVHPVPGVVLLHSGRSDRAAFDPLARRLVAHGLAVLNLDWRGRGASTNKGRGYYDIGLADRALGMRDAAAGFDLLAGLDQVDGRRLGAVGVAHGAEHAVRGSLGDARVRAVVILTGFHLAGDDERQRLLSGELDVLYVTGAGHRTTTAAMRALYEQSRGRRTRFVEVPGSAIGYQLLELHPRLAWTVAAWLEEVLAA